MRVHLCNSIPKPLAFHVFLAIVLAAGLTSTGWGQSTASFQVTIANFGKINENYYRGAQPDPSGVNQLKRLGIKSVIDLQEGGKEEEPTWVHDAGMQYFKIAVPASHPATEEQTALFLKLASEPANLPIYVHCALGRHRTGEMTAIYRITHDSWTADKAFQEMKQYGYYSFPVFGSLKDYVFQYYQQYRQALAKTAQPAAAVTTP